MRALQFLYLWLLKSDLPVALQVFWKLLLWGMASLLWFEVAPAMHSIGGQVAFYAYGAAFALFGLFTKLGDG